MAADALQRVEIKNVRKKRPLHFLSAFFSYFPIPFHPLPLTQANPSLSHPMMSFTFTGSDDKEAGDRGKAPDSSSSLWTLPWGQGDKCVVHWGQTVQKTSSDGLSGE